MKILDDFFYQRDVQSVAQDLIGKRLVRFMNGQRISGIINETEAYDGESDLACHASHGKSRRNAVMYGEAGKAYVYFTYGMHWMLNCVAGVRGYPAAVLIRSILPEEGADFINRNRAPIKKKHWTDGPAKLTKALSITGELNGALLTSVESGLWIEDSIGFPPASIQRTPRIGIQNTPEPWLSKPWRFFVQIRQIDGKKDIISAEMERTRE